MFQKSVSNLTRCQYFNQASKIASYLHSPDSRINLQISLVNYASVYITNHRVKNFAPDIVYGTMKL